MRIGTWNVEHALGREKNQLRRELLAKADADVWVLTETSDELTPGDDYEAVCSAARPNGKARARWVTIWSRLPVQGTLPVHDNDRTAACLITTDGGPLVVFGTVMPWHADRGEAGREPPPRNWHEQYRVIPEQAADWRRLQDGSPNAALCVAGDLNISLGGPSYYGTARGRGLLADAMSANGLACATTYDRLPDGKLKYPMIDHILLSRTLAERARIIQAWEGRSPGGVRLSDHSGVVVEVPPALANIAPAERSDCDPTGTV